jgi:hypothetical protein
MVSKTKQVLLSIGIAIIFAFFIGFGINTFYKSPKYDDYCIRENFREIKNETNCIQANGKWTSYDYYEKPMPVNKQLTCSKIEENNTNIILNCNFFEEKFINEGYCDLYFTCNEEFQKKREEYNRNVFILTTIIGLIAFVCGVILLKVESVGSGIMSGSILIMIYGTFRYWEQASDIIRFILLGIVLTALIYLGYTKLNPNKIKKK